MERTKTVSLPPEICASDDRSFAAYTLRNRLPHILRQIIEDGNYAAEVVGQLESLGIEILEGTITPLPEKGDRTSNLWTEYLQPHLGKRWFNVPFFWVEMYFYRRIIDIIGYQNASDPEAYDPFIVKKRQGFADAQPRTRQLAEWLMAVPETPNVMEALQDLLRANLWSNCADLSQLPETFRPENQDSGENLGLASTRSAERSHPSPALPTTFGHAHQKRTGVSEADRPLPYATRESMAGSKLLINHVAEVAQFIVERSAPLQRVDIILDNTGIELISDLALADFLLRTNCAQQVVLHGKDYPVFVSDATPHDIQFTIREMAVSEVTDVSAWGQRLDEWIGSDTSYTQANQRLAIQTHPFWTLPLYFDAMLPDLHTDMNTSDLWIVKGDANYRRLVGDRHWPLDTPIDPITPYLTVPCLALRVLKCELLVGVDMNKHNGLNLEDDWMTNGTYGIIQFIA